MNAFDGRFALDYIYPLALAAHDEPWNASANSLLATFTRVGEVRVDTQSPSFLLSLASNPSPGSRSLLSSMQKPKGTAVSLAGQPGLPVDDRFGWVCVDPSRDRLIVTFRGSQTQSDWLNDLDFVAEPYRPVPGGGRVDQGFQHVYYSVRDSLLRLVQERRDSVREVLVTGHSLGAALATLALPDIMNFLRQQSGVPGNPVPLLYNLASPRVGDPDFKNFFNTQLPCWRVVNLWDLVPQLPPRLTGYVHVGAELPIDSGFKTDVALSHQLETGYLPGLRAWNEQHSPSQDAAALASPRGREVPSGISD